MSELRLHPDGRRAVSLAQDHTLARLDLETGEAEPHPLEGAPAAAIALDSRGRLYVADLQSRVLGP